MLWCCSWNTHTLVHVGCTSPPPSMCAVCCSLCWCWSQFSHCVIQVCKLSTCNTYLLLSVQVELWWNLILIPLLQLGRMEIFESAHWQHLIVAQSYTCEIKIMRERPEVFIMKYEHTSKDVCCNLLEYLADKIDDQCDEVLWQQKYWEIISVTIVFLPLETVTMFTKEDKLKNVDGSSGVQHSTAHQHNSTSHTPAQPHTGASVSLSPCWVREHNTCVSQLLLIPSSVWSETGYRRERLVNSENILYYQKITLIKLHWWLNA